jgi:hypothetical protein
MEHAQDIINECWRSIDGYLNYQVSNTGQVRNVSTRKLLSDKRRDHRGYLIVYLCQDGIAKNHKVHRLVADHFIPKPDSDCKLEVDHIINDKTNNTVSNLRWVPHRQNMWNRDKIRKDTSSKYIGVSVHKQSRKWHARIRQNDGHKIHLGLFQHEKDAARAYNAKAYELRGNFAVLNDISDDED